MWVLSATSGTLLNALTVLVGGVLGSFIGGRLPARVQEALFGALGLFTVFIGVQGALGAANVLIVLGSLLLGVIVGELANLDGALRRLGDTLQRRLARDGSRVSEAFVASSLVFCVGPLTVLGALENGLSGDITKLAVKAMLDGFAALAFSAALGWGVLLSIGTILVVQGGISLGAQALAPLLKANPLTLRELTAVGGVILIAIGLRLLNLRDLRAANYLPALVAAPLLVVAVTFAQGLLR